MFGKSRNFGKPKWCQRVSHTVRTPESTAGPLRNMQKFRKIETVRDSRRIYQCRKPNLPHNQQLLHASARVHKNMKHARILPLVKNIVSQWLFVSCQFCRKEWRHLITWWYLFSYSLGSAIIHKISFQKMHGSITPPEWYRKVTSWNITIILCLYIVLVNIIFMMMEKSAITR